MSDLPALGRLRGKTVLVTGVSPNIGGGLAEHMAAEGARLVCIDADAANARDCAEAIRKSGAEALGLPCNITDEAAVDATISAACEQFGTIDVLINSAALYNMKGLLAMTPTEFRAQIEVILTGTFIVTRRVAQEMVRAGRGGSIIHIASTEAHQGNPKNVAYCTAKAGLLNMARANAMELAPHGIRVNSLTPTATDPRESVDRAERWGRPRWDVSDSLPLRRAALLPLRRAPVPKDYAYAAVFLASDEARMITGIDLRVDAGAVAQYWAASQQVPDRPAAELTRPCSNHRPPPEA
jgi:NAD(P)-dependent dehydrogenase (short-subunit alcohol dehydrogenase family)